MKYNIISSSNIAFTIWMLSRKCYLTVGFGNVQRWYHSSRQQRMIIRPFNNNNNNNNRITTSPSIIPSSITKSNDYNYYASSSSLVLYVHTVRDADTMERIIGGTRYEYVPIPDAMKETTLYVGNICEFAHDDDLSQLFKKVSKLRSVPACIARKVDTSSLQYGFVSFPTVEEKEQAIIRFNNYEWRGKRLKVEEIKDSTPSGENVRIPGKLVAYVTGGKSLMYESKKKSTINNSKGKSMIQRISRDDVERLSRGQASKQRGYGSRSVPHRLNESERAEWDRAAKRGYLTLVGGGNRRSRKGSPMINIHRQWCDARAKPQILLFKATNGRTVDQVIVDFSPLRLNGLIDGSSSSLDEEDFMVKWKAQTITAAIQAGLDIKEDIDDDDDYDDTTSIDPTNDESSSYTITLENTNQEAWATKPIWQLPVVSLGIFEGERSKAKLMAKTLAELWEIPEETKVSDSSNGGNNNKRNTRNNKSQQEQRKRGGGHRQAW